MRGVVAAAGRKLLLVVGMYARGSGGAVFVT
jgi:hypothetical protein